MKLYDIIKSTTDLVLSDSDIIPAGSTGRIVKIDVLPRGIRKDQWFGVEVHFGGYMTTDQSFPCKEHEIELA